MWAMMPMFRVFSSGACLAIDVGALSALSDQNFKLPAVVSERLVRFGHAVHVFTLLDGAATKVRRIQQLVRKLFLHGLAVAPGAGEADQPSDTERQAARRVHFDRHLVVR